MKRRAAKRILVTGGAGFIGSNFVRRLLVARPDAEVVVLDKLTYAGNRENLRDVAANPRLRFVRGDIADPRKVGALFAAGGFDLVFNFAAETHVDRSILGPPEFVRTDVLGVCTLLEAARRHRVGRFVQISTDEVYGSIPDSAAPEDAPLRPSSPYAASKAAADLLARSYHRTFDLPVIVTRASNTYGGHQHPEKFVPLFTTNALEGVPLPLYGDGAQKRDWLHVDDHCEALLRVATDGTDGEVYNIGANDERANIDVARRIVALVGCSPDLIRPVADRRGHDWRYALNCDKLKRLGWSPRRDFETGLRDTVEWYRTHPAWWKRTKTGEYRAYYERQYGARLAAAGKPTAGKPAGRSPAGAEAAGAPAPIGRLPRRRIPRRRPVRRLA